MACRFSPCTGAILISACSFSTDPHGGRFVKREMKRVCWQLAKPSLSLGLASPK